MLVDAALRDPRHPGAVGRDRAHRALLPPDGERGPRPARPGPHWGPRHHGRAGPCGPGTHTTWRCSSCGPSSPLRRPAPGWHQTLVPRPWAGVPVAPAPVGALPAHIFELTAHTRHQVPEKASGVTAGHTTTVRRDEHPRLTAPCHANGVVRLGGCCRRDGELLVAPVCVSSVTRNVVGPPGAPILPGWHQRPLRTPRAGPLLKPEAVTPTAIT